MGKMVLTFSDVIDLNQYLMEKGLDLKVHLHDRCGSQSFTIEAAGDVQQDQVSAVKNEILEYFNQKGITLKFSDTMTEFSIMQ